MEGFSKDASKIHWINWHKVCSIMEYGGLRERRIMEFNLALLVKWC